MHWSAWVIFLLTLFSLLYSLHSRDKKNALVSATLLIAFGFTRLITESGVQERQYLDFINDLWVCAVLATMWKHPPVKVILCLYAVMAALVYVLETLQLFTFLELTKAYHIVLELLALTQLLVLIGYTHHGNRRRDKRLNISSDNVHSHGLLYIRGLEKLWLSNLNGTDKRNHKHDSW